MSYTQRIWEIINENPGINGGEIRRIVNVESDKQFTALQFNSLLGGLKRRKDYPIENRGGNQYDAKWYVVDTTPTYTESNPYLPEAERILREMRRIVPRFRAEWLAEQLQTLVGK